MAYHWGRNFYLTINGRKIQIYKFEEQLDKSDLYFQIREEKEECEFLYQLYLSREKIIFEFNFERYAEFEFQGWVERFDRVDEEYQQFFIVLHIVIFTKKEQINVI